MLIQLIEWLRDWLGDQPGFRLFQYISFRAGLALMMSLVISIVFGGRIIAWLRKLQIGETVRDLGLSGQKEKEGTPTMGGIIIILSVVIPCLLLARLDNIYIVIMLVSTAWMALIGFIDDYIKVFKKNKDGLSGRFKILGQIGLGLFISLMMMDSHQVVVRMDVREAAKYGLGEEQLVGNRIPVKNSSNGEVTEWRGDYKTSLTNVPFLKGGSFDYAQLLPFEKERAVGLAWLIFVPLVIFVVTAVSNAANLTDGLDGLATGVSGIISITLLAIAYLSGNAIAAKYLGILHLPGSGELVIFAACLVGGTLGFLWWNAYPAQIFMGDTGSLTLGGIIAALAILLRKELLIPILCGIFLIENLSVVLQVSYFKYTKRKYGEGRRIFKMAPLHHHYQKLGMPEVKIVTRFWIVGILLAVATVLTLKIR